MTSSPDRRTDRSPDRRSGRRHDRRPDLGAGVLTADASQATGTDGSPVVRDVPMAGRELRTGEWTRLGAPSVLGDTVTEHTISGLVADARASARAQGYATGWAEGRRAAELRAREEAEVTAAHLHAEEERREAEHRRTLTALARAAAQLQDATAAMCAQVETHAAEVAFALTEQLVGRELEVAEHPGVDAVRRALALAAGEPLVRVRVSPDQAGRPELAALLEPATAAGAAAADAVVTVVADRTLSAADAIVETRAGVVDARLSQALARVREVLLP